MQFSLFRVIAKQALAMPFFVVLILLLFFTITTEKVHSQTLPGFNNDSDFISGVNSPPPRPVILPIGPSGMPSVDAFINNTNPTAPTTPTTGNPSGIPGGGVDATARGDTPSQPAAEPVTQINPGNSVSARIFEFAITYVGRVVSLSGYFFDYALKEFVIGFGNNYKEKNTGFAVETVWGVVRDVFNITFIFGIIYIGFRLILNSDDSRAKSTLVSLLAAALLVNFSLFITKFIIDFANLTATEVYKALPIEDIGGIGGFGELYLRTIRLSSTLDYGSDFSGAEGYPLGYIFGVILLFLITIFVLLAGAVIITIRFFVLLLYMIFSPLMFLGWVFPNFGSITTKWWTGFLGKAFFAPVYVFMLYITFYLTTMYRDGRPDANSSMANIFGGTEAALGGEPFSYFALASISMIASVVIAQKMGATGATTAIAVGHRMRKGAQGWVGRNTAGRFIPATANNLDRIGNKYNDTMSRSWFGTTKTGKVVRFAGRSALAATTLGTSEVVLNRRNINAVGKTAKEAKYGGGYSRADDIAYNTLEEQKQKARIAAASASKKLPRLIELQEKEIAGTISSTELDELRQLRGDTKNSSGGWTVGDGEQKMRSTISGLTTTQVENLSQKERKSIAGLFETGQFDKILESKEISDEDKQKMIEARQKTVKDTLRGTSGIITSELVKLTTTQLETLGAGFIAENAHLLSHSQMEDIKKSKKFTDAQKNSFGANRTKNQKEYLSTGVGIDNLFMETDSSGTFIKARKATEVAQLGKDILTDPAAFSYLDVDILEAIIDKRTLNPADRAVIKRTIARAPSGIPRIAAMQHWLMTPQGQRF